MAMVNTEFQSIFVSTWLNQKDHNFKVEDV